MKTILLFTLLSGSVCFAKTKSDDVNVHCVQQDYFDDYGWWEAKIHKNDQGDLRGDIWWVEDDDSDLACTRKIELTNDEGNLSFESNDGTIYLFIKDIEDGQGYGKLWVSGCEDEPELEKIKMDCTIQ